MCKFTQSYKRVFSHRSVNFKEKSSGSGLIFNTQNILPRSRISSISISDFFHLFFIRRLPLSFWQLSLSPGKSEPQSKSNKDADFYITAILTSKYIFITFMKSINDLVIWLSDNFLGVTIHYLVDSIVHLLGAVPSYRKISQGTELSLVAARGQKPNSAAEQKNFS